MTTAGCLRIASVLSFLFAAGHTLGGRKSWSPLGETETLTAMRSFRFDAMGVNRSYLDFYLGFGYTISVFLLLQTVVLWQLAGLATTEPLKVRPLVAAFAVASAACGLLAWRFIFPLPTIFSVVLTATLVVAWFLRR
jgi:hypothetical protein